jgi:hypothetical protein
METNALLFAASFYVSDAFRFEGHAATLLRRNCLQPRTWHAVLDETANWTTGTAKIQHWRNIVRQSARLAAEYAKRREHRTPLASPQETHEGEKLAALLGVPA